MPETPSNKRYYAYKVVWETPNKTLISANGAFQWHVVNYLVGKWVKPHIGCNQFLFIFNKKKSALAFKSNMIGKDRYHVYRAQVRKPFNVAYNIEHKPKEAGFYPVGTQFTKEVKLLKRVG